MRFLPLFNNVDAVEKTILTFSIARMASDCLFRENRLFRCPPCVLRKNTA
jgi:hypothetical protein